ncbi:MAG: RNA-binding cell elongation regulator Jag/EloR [Actinomycetota bacterium]
MEWVETTGKTIAEAKERALDQLGVHEEDAEFELLDEPKQGLFGRVRGEARVRARVRPTQARQKVDRRDRRREKGDRADKPDAADTPAKSTERVDKPGRPPTGAGQAGRATSDRVRGPRPARPEVAAPKKNPNPSNDGQPKEQLVDARQVGEEAQRFMDALVSAFGLTGTSELVEDGDDLEVRVHGQELGLLVGPRGTTLQAVQDLARVASQRRLGDHDTRLRVDVGGYRERRRVALGSFAEQMAGEVKSSGVARVLEPMSSADRKIIHDTLATVEGIATRSEGDDPFRRVVIAPAND